MMTEEIEITTWNDAERRLVKAYHALATDPKLTMEHSGKTFDLRYWRFGISTGQTFYVWEDGSITKS